MGIVLVSGGGILQLVEQGRGHSPKTSGATKSADGQVTKLKANYLSLSGYRLPTEAEMEFATRAGAVTSRYLRRNGRVAAEVCLVSEELAGTDLAGRESEAERFGLFDVQGNVFNWCQEIAKNCQITKGEVAVEDVEDGLVIDGPKGPYATWLLVLTLTPPTGVRSACRNSDRPFGS